ncbi:MAG: toll/interleukin-1 receptor domain-containing protein [Solirubrobacteraceae bacterium]
MPGDTRSVFISHSCKDFQPGPAGDDEEARDRRERRAVAREVRDHIVQGLTERGYSVRLDITSLRPSDHWRAELHAWLGSCDGAVILLDIDSARSEWVRKEATILGWRKDLGSRLKLVPVFLPGFRSRDLSAAGLGALKLEEIEAARWREGDTPADLAARVVGEFADLTSTSKDETLMRRWVRDVKLLLDQTDPEEYLEDLARALGISDEEYANFPERTLYIAYHLLHTDPAVSSEALPYLRRGLHAEKRGELVELLTPGWVSEESARELYVLLHGQEPSEAAVAGTTEMPPAPLLCVHYDELGIDYILRAQCCQVDAFFVVSCAKIGEHPDEAVRRVQNALLERIARPAITKQNLRLFLDRKRFYLLLGPGAAREDVIRALRAEFGGRVSLVLLAAEPVTEAPGPWAAIVTPPLEPEEAELALVTRESAWAGMH